MFAALKRAWKLKGSQRTISNREVFKIATAWFLFGAIILVFIFWGMRPNSQGFGQGGVAAYVNNAAIPMRQVLQTVENMRQNQEQAADAGQEEQMHSRREIEALQQLVQQELIAQAADRAGIIVSDGEIRDLLLQQTAFQENGQFKRELYQRYLSATGQTAGELETSIRRQLLMQKIQRAFSTALRPNEMEMKKQKEMGEIKANVEFLAISTNPSDLTQKANQISDNDAKEFAAKNAERVKVYFESHKMEFAQSEEVHARHILVKFKLGDAESESAAAKKAKQLAEKLAQSTDFAKLATSESDDPGSKSKGGDLGWFGRGRMVPEFEKVAFSLPLKKISDPIKTNYGYHLIEVLEKKDAHTAELNQETQLAIGRKLAAQERAEKETLELSELAKKGDMAAIDKFAKDNKLKWEESGPFAVDATSVPRIGANEDLAKAAFALTAAKPLAPGIFREGEKAYVIRYKALPSEKVASKKAANPNGMPDLSDPAVLQPLMASQLARQTMSGWLQTLQKSASIKLNPQVAGR